MNMKMKKIISGIITAALCIPCLTAWAEDGGWKTELFGSDKTDKTKYYAVNSMEKAYDGSYSLNVVYPGRAKAGNYMEVTNTLKGDIASGTYDIKFYIRDNFSSTSKLVIGESEYTFDNAVWSVETLTAPSGETDWKCYSASVELPDITSPVFKFVFGGPVAGCYIDEVSLCPSGTDENYVTVGGFETYVQEEIEYDGDLYIPTAVMYAPTSDGGITVSWKNPQSETVKKISLYDVTDGEEEFITDSFEVTANTFCKYTTGELVEGDSYLYKLVFEYSDVPAMEYFITAKARNAVASHAYNPVGAWSVISNHSGDTGYGLQRVEIDTKEKHSGEASLKFMTNAEAVLPSIYLAVSTSIAPTAGNDYEFSFWTKSLNSSRNMKVHMNWKIFDKGFSDSNYFMMGTSGTYEWKQIVAKKTEIESASTSLSFAFDHPTDGFWIDDVEFYELDADGNRIGENLIKDGGFEDLLIPTDMELTASEPVPDNGSAYLSWTLHGENPEGVNLYQKVGEDWVSRGFVGKAFTSAEFTKLMYESDYEMKIVPVNTDGIEDDGEEVSFTTYAPDYEIKNPQVLLSGTPVEEITTGGYYSARISVKNNVFTDGLKCELLVGIYRNGALYKAVSSSKNISCTPANATATNVAVTFEIPDDGEDYSVKLFSLDSKADGNVLYPCVEIK